MIGKKLRKFRGRVVLAVHFNIRGCPIVFCGNVHVPYIPCCSMMITPQSTATLGQYPPTLAAHSAPPRFMSAPLANVGGSHTPTFGGARTRRNCAIGRKARIVMIDTQPFVGQHCETTTVGTLLGQLGIHLSEPMLFGPGGRGWPTPYGK